ncbi:hypothetical protein [Nonomuraea sp. NPDC049725]
MVGIGFLLLSSLLLAVGLYGSTYGIDRPKRASTPGSSCSP